MQNSVKIQISHALASRLLPLTLSVFFLIALVIPISFGAIEYRRLESTAGTYARQLADIITIIASSSPRLWKFQATKYSEAMNTFLSHKGIAAIDVLDDGNSPVSQFNQTAQQGKLSSWTVQGKPAAIILNNVRIGEVRIRVATYSALLMVASLLAGCVIIGGLLCLLLYRLPLRVVQNLEQRLLAYQDSLEGLVRKRTRELEEARVKAESANRAKGLFLANMSHEIRTPMSAIIGMTHLAMQAKSEDQRRRFMETVQHSSENLLGLLNDILDFSKMEAGQLQLNTVPFNLRRLLHDIVSTMGVSANEKGLELTIEVEDQLPEVVIGDDMRLRQILLNLVGNAVKFTSKGAITICVTQNSPGGPASVHFTVTDTGIGIPADKCALIFNSFQQADSSFARQFGGTGLGLSICSQLVSLMGGRIWVESQEQAGSAFHFTALLPASSDRLVEMSVTEHVASKAITGLHILVVDDNEVNRDVASMTLEQTHEIDTAVNGLEALTRLASRPFDIVLMDVQMPSMDGLTATAMIRALEREQPLPLPLPEALHSDLVARLRGGHIPIVAMTAQAMSEDREMCLAAGMDAYITKPFQPAQILREVASLFQGDLDRPVEGPEPETMAIGIFRGPEPDMARIRGHLLATTGLTPTQIDRLLIAFRQSFKSNLAKMELAISAADAPTLAMAAHTLKGTLLQCDLQELAKMSETIDRLAQNNQLDGCAAPLMLLHTHLTHLLAAEESEPGMAC